MQRVLYIGDSQKEETAFAATVELMVKAERREWLGNTEGKAIRPGLSFCLRLVFVSLKTCMARR